MRAIKSLAFTIVLIILLSSCRQEKIKNILDPKLEYNLKSFYISQFGEKSDLISFNPLFKLESDSIHNKTQSKKIQKLPENLKESKTAYCFFYFSGVNTSLFKNELVALVENYTEENPTIFIDKNGNLDFTDDGPPDTLKDNSTLKLENGDNKSAIFHYQIFKSQVNSQYADRLKQKFDNKFPKSTIVSANYWLANKRLPLRVSKHYVDNKPITILLFDNSADGMFSFQTDELGDRILILEGHIDTNEGLTSLLKFAEPVSHNAVFKLYDKKYYVEKVATNGSKVILSKTNKEPSYNFKNVTDLPSLSITLLSGSKVTLKELMGTKKYLLIDVGGTWCSGCVAQELIIKNIYNKGKVEVLGVFKHDTFKSVKRYVSEHELKWPVALVNEEFDDVFRIKSFPTYILISNNGKIVMTDIDANKIESFISKL